MLYFETESNVCLYYILYIEFSFRIVKLTSPKLNYVIIVGVAILLTGLILYCLPIRNVLLFKFICTVSNQLCKVMVNYMTSLNLVLWSKLDLGYVTNVCLYPDIGTCGHINITCLFFQIRRFFTSTGHDIGFTVALMKTWRVHYIFRSPSPNKRV